MDVTLSLNLAAPYSTSELRCSHAPIAPPLNIDKLLSQLQGALLVPLFPLKSPHR